MITLIELLVLVGIIGGLACWRASCKVWTPVIAVVLLAFSWHSHFPWYVLGLFWILYLIPAIFFNVSQLHRQYLSLPILKYFRKALPPMSDTEREALDAGDVWWDGELFCGNPNWEKLFSMKLSELTAEEQSFLDNQTNQLCALLDDWEIVEQEHDIPEQAWDYLKKERFFGMIIPKEYGGLGFSALAHAAVVTRLCSHCISAAVTAMVPNSLGPGELLMKYGTDEQKNYYLPRLAKGDDIPCFGLTGPDAGSDAAAMTDRGIVCHGEHDGKKVLGIRLNFDKRYITLAPVATVVGLAFKLFDPDKLLGDEENVGITLALLPATHPGVEIGNRHIPGYTAFMNGPIRGKDVFIPLEWIIGGVDMVGQGWRMLMECLSIGRSISLPAIGTATGQLLFRGTGAYASVRQQFRTSLGKFDGVQEVMGRLGGFAYMTNASQQFTCTAIDTGVKPAVASAIAKYHMTEMLRHMVNDAFDIHAGKGVQRGPKNYIASAYGSAPIAITVEGANILTRNLIIFGQGAMRCHPYIRKEIDAANIDDKTKSLAEFDKILMSHIGFTVSNVVRTLWYGISGGHFIKTPLTGPTARYLKQMTRMSCALATVADFAMMLLGGALKRKERLSARLGDVLSYLYLASAVYKYHQASGLNQDDIPFVHWALTYCLYQMQTAFDNFFNNFPVKGLRWILKRLVFPWGHSYQMPRDSLDRKISAKMMEPSAFRDRVSQYCYLSEDENNPVRLLDDALVKMVACKSILKKMQNAIRNNTISIDSTFEERVEQALANDVLTSDEATQLREFEALRVAVVKVDEFPAEYFIRKQNLCQENSKVA